MYSSLETLLSETKNNLFAWKRAQFRTRSAVHPYYIFLSCGVQPAAAISCTLFYSLSRYWNPVILRKLTGNETQLCAKLWQKVEIVYVMS
jgi:hypothetical protein